MLSKAENKNDVKNLMDNVKREIELRKDLLRVQPEIKRFDQSNHLLRMNQLRELIKSALLEADEALNDTHVKSRWPTCLNPLFRVKNQKNVDRRLIKSIQLLSKAVSLLAEDRQAKVETAPKEDGAADPDVIN